MIVGDGGLSNAIEGEAGAVRGEAGTTGKTVKDGGGLEWRDVCPVCGSTVSTDLKKSGVPIKKSSGTSFLPESRVGGMVRGPPMDLPNVAEGIAAAGPVMPGMSS